MLKNRASILNNETIMVKFLRVVGGCLGIDRR